MHRPRIAARTPFAWLLVLSASGDGAWARPIACISLAPGGTMGNNHSYYAPALSFDGRFVAFFSSASNLVPGDTNNSWDAFVRDRQTGQTTRVSVASDGTQGNNWSDNVLSISLDGRVVAFASYATNLVPGDTNGRRDVFVHDRLTGITSRVSVASDGTQGNSDSSLPSLSVDGRFVAFSSAASNLVPGDTNLASDIFVHDRNWGTTTRVSVASDGTQSQNISPNSSPVISADGRFVAFNSAASNLVPGDTNGQVDVFVHDRQTGQTTRVSVATSGAQGNGNSSGPAITADGRYVAFRSSASNLVPSDTNSADDVFVHDRQTGETSRVSVGSGGTQGNGWSANPSISGGGRFVAFFAAASNLVPGDTNSAWDVFVHDRQTGETTRVSTAADGTQGNGASQSCAISADGRFVGFESAASNLVPDDANGWRDIFIHERPPPPCPGDANGDGVVDFLDITSILVNWGSAYPPGPPGPGDANGDATVNFLDITTVLVNWQSPC